MLLRIENQLNGVENNQNAVRHPVQWVYQVCNHVCKNHIRY